MMSEPANPARIFIVDDDRGLLRLVEKTLQREGFDTVSAGSGSEAIAWLSENSADLMLLDLKLQDMEGQALVHKVVSMDRAIPFIIITGQGDERVAVEMMKRGALDYLVKDGDFIGFVSTVVRRGLDQIEKDRRLAAAQIALDESRREVLAISEREQKRFGAELHDGLGQQLAAIELMCQSLRQDLRSIRPDLHEEISRICQFLREAIAQTRSMAHGLSPVNLESGGLAEALRELALRMSVGGRFRCVFQTSSEVTVADPLVAGHLFRIAQEAANNAVKHSRGEHVEICLEQKKQTLRLTVVDNGEGFPKSSEKGQGIGLQVMKHRASVIGGELEIKSTPGKGVTVICTVPKEKK